MNKRKVKYSKTYLCSHCGFEIAVIYDTGDGHMLESCAGRLRSGFGAAIYDSMSGQATILCPECGKVTQVTWVLRAWHRTRARS